MKYDDLHWKMFNFHWEDQSDEAIDFRRAVIRSTEERLSVPTTEYMTVDRAIALYHGKIISQNDLVKTLSKITGIPLSGEVGQYDKMYGDA